MKSVVFSSSNAFLANSTAALGGVATAADAFAAAGVGFLSLAALLDEAEVPVGCCSGCFAGSALGL
jgi:hypothetical protein